MITCFSGLGSGAYPAYWGFHDDQTLASLTVDFEVPELLARHGFPPSNQ